MTSKKRFQKAKARGAETKNHQVLDLEQSYPCPICRQGTLEPITLTEAWGCDRCRQIFERGADTHTIGKLSTPYHRQRRWHWNGKQWMLVSQHEKPRAFNAAAAAILGFLLWVALSRIDRLGLSSVLLLGIALAVLLLVVIFWVQWRR